MWGGRYKLGPAEIMERINASIGFDRRLYAQDIAGSLAHADMLVAQGILTAKDGRTIRRGLVKVRDEIEGGRFKFSTRLEDIHMNVESRLAELIGPVAGRLHTARSRNDQVALDVRLWVRDTIDRLEPMLQDLQAALIDRADEHAGTIMPGFTHLQTAQPITFGHHLLAYVEMIGRDRSRLADCRARLNQSPLGAAALAGSPHPIDPRKTAKALGFDRPMANSLDAVSDRDYVIEFIAAASEGLRADRIWAEEIVIWCSAPFRQAHHVTGTLVGKAAEKGIDLDKLSLSEMQAVERRITRDVYRVLTVEASVRARKSLGGTAPANVARAAREARRRFLGRSKGARR